MSQLIDFAANTFFSSANVARFVAELRWGIQQHLLRQGDFIVESDGTYNDAVDG